jgi:hypothetical protein
VHFRNRTHRRPQAHQLVALVRMLVALVRMLVTFVRMLVAFVRMLVAFVRMQPCSQQQAMAAAS